MLKQRRGKRRIIFHLDMNCFYAAVEMAKDPRLQGKPVAIAGNPQERRGIIVTSSYEARAKGIKTTMPLWKARELCPELIVRRPNFERYREASREIFQLLSEITPKIQPVSIDEGYMDITDCEHLGNPVQVAIDIQKRILNELKLPCSIGIGPNMFLAKMASDMKKPLGITILRIRDLPQKLWPLPVEKMHGVGEKSTEKLNQIGIKTIKDLAEANVYDLTHLLGINGERLKNRAQGIDLRPVDPEAVSDFKSIGSSRTLAKDTTSEKEILTLMKDLAGNVSRRMKRRQLVGMSVQLMIRFHDRQTITRSRKLPVYIEEAQDILEASQQLLQDHWDLTPIRLLGVTVQHLAEKSEIAEQLNLFTYENKLEKDKLQSVVHSLSEKYGKEVFTPLQSAEKKDENEIITSFQKDYLDDYRR